VHRNKVTPRSSFTHSLSEDCYPKKCIWCAAAWESKEAFIKYIKKEDTKGRQICKYIQVLHSACSLLMQNAVLLQTE
jgi:hypothetical protein